MTKRQYCLHPENQAPESFATAVSLLFKYKTKKKKISLKKVIIFHCRHALKTLKFSGKSFQPKGRDILDLGILNHSLSPSQNNCALSPPPPILISLRSRRRGLFLHDIDNLIILALEKTNSF